MDQLRLIAAYAILAVWMLSMVLNAFDRSYAPPAYINIFAGAVVTMLFGAPYLKKKMNGGDKNASG